MKIQEQTRRVFGKAAIAGATLGLLLAPSTSLALRITSSGDAALAGALVEDFDGYADSNFTSQDFLIGGVGFNVAPLADDIAIGSEFCGSFGTTGSCLDTLSSTNGTNDDFDVVFTGPGVSAFAFDINALDNDWTVSTFDTNDVLLNTYTILSQSPALTGFDRRGYFGATEAVPIQYFTIRSATNDRALIDNLAYAPVPEPSTALLAGLGLIGLSRVGRKKSRKG